MSYPAPPTIRRCLERSVEADQCLPEVQLTAIGVSLRKNERSGSQDKRTGLHVDHRLDQQAGHVVGVHIGRGTAILKVAVALNTQSQTDSLVSHPSHASKVLGQRGTQALDATSAAATTAGVHTWDPCTARTRMLCCELVGSVV
eukprot:1150751-Pelagomonas_calceolata.AAC.11